MIRIIVATCFACVFSGQAFAAELVYVNNVCVWESFDASCPSNHEVIFIRKAFFGRLRSSRCFNLSSGEKPCYADVQSFVERHCGGRRNCKIKLTNENLKLVPSNCSAYDQKSLEIEYSCQEVYRPTAEDQPCVANQSLIVTTTSGYLANIVTDETGQGSQLCPWRFVPRSGQTVHLTLLDFGVWIDSADRDRRDMCKIYATIKEIESTHRKSEREMLVCRGREKFIMSTESEMSIAMMKQERTVNDTTYFLIKYQVFDCPSFEAPALATTERSGSDIRITCEFNSTMYWDVKCVEGNWTPNHIINCPEMTTTAPPCPAIIPPEGTTVNYTDNGYNALAHCSNGPSVELLCINGVWTPNQTSVCFNSPMTGTQATTGESTSSSDQLNMVIIAGSAAFVALVVVVAIGATVACRKRQTEKKKKMNGSIRSHSNNSYYTGQLLIDRPTNRVQSEIYETLDESRMQDVVEAPPIPCSPSCSQGTERNAKTLQPNQKLEPWTDPSMLRRCDTLPVHRPLPEPNEYTTPLSRDSTYLMPREPVYLNPAVCDDAVKGQMF